MAVRNSLLERSSGKFRRCWEMIPRFSPIFQQREMLSLPRFGHFPARKTAAGKLAAPAGTLLDFFLRDRHSLKGRTTICGFLSVPAVFCENLRLPNALFSRRRGESAKIRGYLRFSSACPLKISPLPKALRDILMSRGKIVAPPSRDNFWLAITLAQIVF